MRNKNLKRYILALLLTTFIGCQSAENLSIQTNSQNQVNQIYKHDLKERLTIRTDHLIDGIVPVNSHEKRAYQYPESYIIEGKTYSKKVALTFDDGPSKYTLQILNKLNEYNIKATFFMTGNAIKSFPNLVKQLHDEGHLIANHSWDHSNANEYQVPENYWQEQILPTNNLIKHITGVTPSLFRPPFGSTTEKIVNKLITQKMKTVIWSIDTQDWNDNINTEKNIAALAIKYAHPEAIILMHDGGGNRQSTVDALDEIIQHYRQLDYQFVTVEKLISSH
ncbi:polysaccharide deacetylase family protein [Thalassotalea castellviae]|uniref:Polysaccharide deacetylase family protein n=1 Tax=Thalassotalea castellviae TaxID=3075612 RepID=A0ABU3A1C5_9GAMM|nr:polysaccharide deacetylase family protein [Thalassotalea sp. W431]MDT0602923.1 polysaccharide deacetylase family protein [Thalassotalea sp. W431]